MSTTACNHCGRKITFSDEHLSKNGIHIPLEVNLTGNHNCPARQQEYYIWRQKHRKYKKCYKCGDSIYWDERQRTDKGKWIPIDAATAAPHLCIYK